MTSVATNQPYKNKEPEVQPQESHTLKTTQTKNDTSPSEKKSLEPDTKELNLIPKIIVFEFNK